MKTYDTWMRFGDGDGGLDPEDPHMDSLSPRHGRTPKDAAREVLRLHPDYPGGIIAVREAGCDTAPLHVFRLTKARKLKRVA